VNRISSQLARWAGTLKQQTLIVYFAARDPRTPFLVRLLALLVAAYALSPIDLIPDFIPVIGYLDDLILLPLGIALIVKLTPAEVIAAARAKAASLAEKPTSKLAAFAIVALWILVIWLIGKWLVSRFAL
jgi:uncharacterized membrane protein YkvA (DUF1232 family)